jgi:hypothetical protein
VDYGAPTAAFPGAHDALRSTPHDRRTHMGSNAKKKTTMAKLNRESDVRERRARKQAKKDARKQDAARQRAGTNDTATGDAGVTAPG